MWIVADGDTRSRILRGFTPINPISDTTNRRTIVVPQNFAREGVLKITFANKTSSLLTTIFNHYMRCY